MIYIKTFFLFLRIVFNLHKYRDFLDKPDGLGRKWTLYKRPIFGKRMRDKKAKIPETKAHHFLYHAFESLESKDPKSFKKEMLDNIILGIIWYNVCEVNEELKED